MNSPRTPQTSLSAELKDIITTRNMLTTRTRMKVLKALDEIEEQNSEKKQEHLRAQAIHETLSSEVSYLKQLELVMEYFMKPITMKNLLDSTTYAILFENIETLYNVNYTLFKELTEDSNNIAQAFYKLAPFFKLYSVYAYNYKRALHLLQDIQSSNPEAADFITKQETRPEVNQKLSALLITPIQRVPRYRLLIKEVLRYTSSRHNDYKTLMESLVEIEKVAEHINALVAEYEDAQDLIELQARISNTINLIVPSRKLIRQGPLMRVSRKRNASYRRHFILFNDILLYCKGDPDHSLTVCCLLPLSKCKIEKVLSNKLFKIICKQEVLLVYSEMGDSEEWIIALQNAIKKYIECRQTLRKESSSRLPLRHVNRFTSDSRIDKRLKRRRNADDPAGIDLQNNSKIIYMSQDLDTSINDVNCFPPCIKRLKKNNDESSKQNTLRNTSISRISENEETINTETTHNHDFSDLYMKDLELTMDRKRRKQRQTVESKACDFNRSTGLMNNFRQYVSSLRTYFSGFFTK